MTLYLVYFAAVFLGCHATFPPKTAAMETTLYRAFSYSNLVAPCVAEKLRQRFASDVDQNFKKLHHTYSDWLLTRGSMWGGGFFTSLKQGQLS